MYYGIAIQISSSASLLFAVSTFFSLSLCWVCWVLHLRNEYKLFEVIESSICLDGSKRWPPLSATHCDDNINPFKVCVINLFLVFVLIKFTFENVLSQDALECGRTSTSRANCTHILSTGFYSHSTGNDTRGRFLHWPSIFCVSSVFVRGTRHGRLSTRLDIVVGLLASPIRAHFGLNHANFARMCRSLKS